jgi:hypothetical protein
LITGFFDPTPSSGIEPNVKRFAPTAQAAAPGTCRECHDLAHFWSQPTEEPVELAGERFLVLRYACLCQCGCPAILATSLPYPGLLPSDPDTPQVIPGH